MADRSPVTIFQEGGLVIEEIRPGEFRCSVPRGYRGRNPQKIIEELVISRIEASVEIDVEQAERFWRRIQAGQVRRLG